MSGDTQGDTQAFIQQYLRDAQLAAQQLGFPVSVVLAQWINETGSGGAKAFRQDNNYAGVSLHGQIMHFPDKTSGLAGYISRWKEPVYGPTRATIAAAGGIRANPYEAAKAFEQSPWAAGHYGGSGLENLIAQENLQQYDGGNIQYPIPADLAAALKNGGGGTEGGATGGDGTGGSSTDDECLLKLPGVNLGIGTLGGNCLMHRSGGRAVLGATALVAGGLILIVGLAFIASQTKAGKQVISTAGAVGAVKG